MRYAVEKTEKYTLFTLEESKMDTLIAPKVKSEVVTLCQTGTTNLIFDLSAVKYMDSSGLSALLLAHRSTKGLGGLCVLAGVQEHVSKLIHISRLDQVFDLLPTVAESIDRVFLHELEKDLNSEEGGE
jgi:anti-anti-sigma factor